MAALASDAATQDPIDLAIFAAAHEQKDTGHGSPTPSIHSIRSRHQAFGSNLRARRPPNCVVIEGRAGCADSPGCATRGALRAKSNGSQEQGARVLAVAAGTEHSLEFVGSRRTWQTRFAKTPNRWWKILRKWACASSWSPETESPPRAPSPLQVGVGERVGSAESLRKDAALAAEQFRCIRRSFSRRQVPPGAGACSTRDTLSA